MRHRYTLAPRPGARDDAAYVKRCELQFPDAGQASSNVLPASSSLFFEAAENDDCIMSAEAEGIGQADR